MVISMFDLFPKDDKQLLYMMAGLLFSIVFSIFINKSRVDIVSLKELKSLVYELKDLRRGSHSSYKRDYFSTTKIVIGYLIVLWIVGKLDFEGKALIQLFLAVNGIIHALMFSKLWGICPYCNYKVHNITRRTGAITCKACKSRIVIHGTELTRPLGRRRG
jgi:DNA-directed RNA polymerase subunit RPC12/RpoP